MELTTTSQSISYANLQKISSIFPSRATLCSSSNFINFLGFNCISKKIKCSTRQLRNFGPIYASVVESNSTNGSSVSWVLEFIGMYFLLYFLTCFFLMYCIIFLRFQLLSTRVIFVFIIFCFGLIYLN